MTVFLLILLRLFARIYRNSHTAATRMPPQWPVVAVTTAGFSRRSPVVAVSGTGLSGLRTARRSPLCTIDMPDESGYQLTGSNSFDTALAGSSHHSAAVYIHILCIDIFILLLSLEDQGKP